MSSTSIEMKLEQLAEVQFPLANKFYKQARYSSKAVRGETVFVLRQPSGIVAAVRLEPKRDDWYFLRAMCVAPEYRGQGVGRQFLKLLGDFLRHHPVYCFPFDHLCEFYGAAGFVKCAVGQSPEFVRTPFERYTQQGRKICVMANRDWELNHV